MLGKIRDYERGYKNENATLQKIRLSERGAYATAREATESLLDATNIMGCEEAVVAGVVAGILKSHRYLQSQGITALLTALGEFGRLEDQSDARNEFAKETCGLLPKLLKDRIYWKD